MARPKPKVKRKRSPIPMLPNLNIMSVKDEPLESQILPSMYEDERISTARYHELTVSTNKHRKHVPNLVYHPVQAPTRANSKGWKHVLQGSNQFRENSLFKIETESDGYILVQFLNNNIDGSIRKGVHHFLKNHHSCRNEPFEDGKMVAAGHRYEARTATFCSYANVQKSCSNFEQQQIEKECFVAFDNLIRNCSETFCEDHRRTMKELEEAHNIMKIGKEYKLLPTYAASDSLNNSLHVDCNDTSRCYAVFYQQHQGIGKSFLVFPKYSLAIECWRCPVLVSWEGYRQLHSTITVKSGIHSLFGAGTHAVARIKQQLHDFAYQPKQSEKKLEIGDIVDVEFHVEEHELAQYDDIYKTKKRNGILFAIRKAKVTKIVGDSVTFIYLGKFKHKRKRVTVPKKHVLPAKKRTNTKRET